jgi:hypothetical protein
MFRELIDEPIYGYNHETVFLTPGTVLPNGATVVKCTMVTMRVAGDVFASWKALCVCGGENYHNYAVWQVVARPEGWHTESGYYFHALEDAIAHLEGRHG